MLRPHDRIAGRIVAKRVVVHRAVVLIALRIAGVEEAGPVRLPRDAAGATVRDAFPQQRTITGPDDPELGVLGAALRHPERHQGSVVGRGIPVNGRRRVVDRVGGVDQGA